MMADITMCLESQCPKKETCYRHKATPNEYRQSYFIDNMDIENCEYYIPIKEDENK